MAARALSANWRALIDTAGDFRITLTNFFTRYIAVPVRDIYKTIRYDTSSFKVMDAG